MPTTSMQSTIRPIPGKTCLITGATSGIGKAAALQLARLGAQVILHGRNLERCQTTAQRIRQEIENAKVEIAVADMSSQAQVRRLAQEIRSQHKRLDVLVNNAGAFFLKRQLSPDGIEMTLAVNHLGYFLLTLELLDLLKAGAPSRIINVSSSAHGAGSFDLNDINLKKRYRSWQAYGRSKLANVLFTYELARRLNSNHIPPVTVNALHPGYVATQIGTNNGLLAKWGVNLWHKLPFNKFPITPEEGAQTIVYLATSPEVEGVTGKYFYECKVANSSPLSYDSDLACKVWEISQGLIQKPVQS